MSSLIFAAILLFVAFAVMLSPLPQEIAMLRKLIASGITILSLFTVAYTGISYNDSGYCEHIRTMWGTESVKCDLGWYVSGWGQQTQWPQYITIANTASNEAQGSDIQPPYRIRLADQWTGDISQTTRFGIPQDPEQFLKMAHDFRSPERLITTTLRPAITSSLDSVANLYTMEDYWSNGKRDEFKTEFESALKKGRPAIDRQEIAKINVDMSNKVAPSNDPNIADTATTSNNETTKVITKRQLDKNGMEIRIPHDYISYGIVVSSAIVENLDPDDVFEDKIQERKEAASRRIIAREQRLEQEEQTLLATAKADRDIAERQGQARVMQIEQTTNADTEKKLALTTSQKIKEQAVIEQDTAKIILERAKIDAEAVKVTADAEAYKKKAVIEADNALTQKLDAEVAIQKVWADAFARRQVPSIMMAGANEQGSGTDGEVTKLMQLLTVDAAKRLAYDRTLQPTPAK